MASSDGRDTLKDAGTIWKFLDNLSLNNPEEYRKYINKILKEGAEMGLGPPEPRFCVQTTKTAAVIPVRKYFLNVAEWKQVPQHMSPDSPIPICAGKLRKELVEREWAMIIDVCMHPGVLSKCESDIEKCELVELVLKYVEETEGLQLSRKYKFVSGKYTGNQDVLMNLMCPAQLQESLSQTVNGDVTRESVLGQLNKSSEKTEKLGPPDTLKAAVNESNESLLRQLQMEKDGIMDKKMPDEKPTTSPSSTTTTTTTATKYDPIITANMNAPSLTETQTKLYSDSETKTEPNLKRPRVEMDVDKDEGVVELTVYLPNVASVKECDLEVQPEHLSLTVFEKYQLELDLPVRIDVDESKAKFVKDVGILLITAKVDMPS